MNIDEGSLLAVERQNFILNILERDGVVRTTELKELLGVSVATIRADLRELEAEGACQLVWGGAIANNRPHSKRSAGPSSADLNADVKRRIGMRAAQLLETGQTIIVDAGTTTLELIYNLAPETEYLRIVTAGLNVAVAAAQFPHMELIMTGGILRHLTRSLIGSKVHETLQSIHADWTFLATGGFSVEHGITTSNTLEAEVKRTMVSRASKVVLLADSSKYGKVLSLQVTPINAIQILITDAGLSDEAANTIISIGVEVIRV